MFNWGTRGCFARAGMPMEDTDNIIDALAGSREMNVRLEVFEGPLDLLLFLIRKNEIDIYDIPIAEVTEQYMGVIRSMENMSLEVAGEFFVMAATLMYIKSRMLLPVDERAPGEEDEGDSDLDPRWQLVEQLLEYKRVKAQSQALEDMIDSRQGYGERRIFDKDAPALERPLATSDKMEMWTAFNTVLRRLAEKLVEGRINAEGVTISDRMEYILSIRQKRFTFTSLFEGQKASVAGIIATFLALLELARLMKLRLSQNASFDEIYCERVDEPAEGNGENSSEESGAELGAGHAAEPDANGGFHNGAANAEGAQEP